MAVFNYLKTVINNCNDTIWPAFSDSLDSNVEDAGGFEAPPNSTNTVSLPDEWVGYFCSFINVLLWTFN
jgi:hypothetical protein